MTADYLAIDALTHARESLGNTLDWVHEHLADHYGLEWIDGEEYLPEALNKVMAALYGIANDITEMAVEVGAYHRRPDGELMRPIYYSTHRPVYVQNRAERVREQCECTYLAHPNGQPHPVTETDTRRAGLTAIQGGANNE